MWNKKRFIGVAHKGVWNLMLVNRVAHFIDHHCVGSWNFWVSVLREIKVFFSKFIENFFFIYINFFMFLDQFISM